jgi:hypothetical protein
LRGLTPDERLGTRWELGLKYRSQGLWTKKRLAWARARPDGERPPHHELDAARRRFHRTEGRNERLREGAGDR